MDLQRKEVIVRDCLYKLNEILVNTREEAGLDSLTEGELLIRELQKQMHEVFLLLKLVPKSSTPKLLDTSSLCEWKLKGEGNFGTVYECRLQGTKVAVKVLKDQAKASFMESCLLKELRHDNIVGFRGMGYLSDIQMDRLVSDQTSRATRPSVGKSPSYDCEMDIESEVFAEFPTKGTRVLNCPGMLDVSHSVVTEELSKTGGYIDDTMIHLTSGLHSKPRKQKTTADRKTGGKRVNDVEVLNKQKQPKHHSGDSASNSLSKYIEQGQFGDAIPLPFSCISQNEGKGKLQRDICIGDCSNAEINAFNSQFGQHHCGTGHGALSRMSLCMVMEYIDMNLHGYIRSRANTLGLSAAVTWDIAGQILHALAYLHGMHIVHRDLKPDNILVEAGPVRVKVKVADFGLAWGTESCLDNTSHGCVVESEGSPRSYVHVRWGAPEFVFSCPTFPTFLDYKRGDMYSFGLVLCFALTGEKVLANLSTLQLLSDLQNSRIDVLHTKQKQECTKFSMFAPLSSPQLNNQYSGHILEAASVTDIGSHHTDILKDITLPVDLDGPLMHVIDSCLKKNPSERPLTEHLLADVFKSEVNPYDIDPAHIEFFSYGFVTNSNIFVSDSLCTSPQGFYESGVRPTGYDERNLLCETVIDTLQNTAVPESWSDDQVKVYTETVGRYNALAERKEIDNNPLVALKNLVISRTGVEEKQSIEFNFQETLYCHHRTMRDMWQSLSDKEKDRAVPCKSIVNLHYSNSFGLHVAILTNEGPTDPQKFVFCRRSRKNMMPSPRAITCGCVESASTLDYRLCGDKWYVDLVNTAARGLMEEIGIELTGRDLDAICLTTVYLKFDFHEWGLCGFVDLKDKRIVKEHRLSADNIKARFTSGPKDKFEHQTLTFVDFQLEPMLKFVSENHENFASSAKLVVVKVLEAFFGVRRVEMAFKHYPLMYDFPVSLFPLWATVGNQLYEEATP